MDLLEVKPSQDPNFITTIGEYAESLLLNMEYYNTRFYRIPRQIDLDIHKNILIWREKRERKRKNQTQLHKLVRGVQVRALSKDVMRYCVDMVV